MENELTLHHVVHEVHETGTESPATGSSVCMNIANDQVLGNMPVSQGFTGRADAQQAEKTRSRVSGDNPLRGSGAAAVRERIAKYVFMLLASIAVWELAEPCAVTNASTLSLSSDTVSLGARSSAQIISLSSVDNCSELLSVRQLIILSEISLTSAALACI